MSASSISDVGETGEESDDGPTQNDSNNCSSDPAGLRTSLNRGVTMEALLFALLDGLSNIVTDFFFVVGLWSAELLDRRAPGRDDISKAP